MNWDYLWLGSDRFCPLLFWIHTGLMIDRIGYWGNWLWNRIWRVLSGVFSSEQNVSASWQTPTDSCTWQSCRIEAYSARLDAWNRSFFARIAQIWAHFLRNNECFIKYVTNFDFKQKKPNAIIPISLNCWNVSVFKSRHFDISINSM
jgi:hypothetical protein